MTELPVSDEAHTLSEEPEDLSKKVRQLSIIKNNLSNKK